MSLRGLISGVLSSMVHSSVYPTALNTWENSTAELKRDVVPHHKHKPCQNVTTTASVKAVARPVLILNTTDAVA